MKTESTRVFLQKALSSIPDDFKLREVRFHLQQAAKKLANVEKQRAAKTSEKPTQYQQWRERLYGNLQNPLTTKHTLDIINDMLEDEQTKLEDIKNKKPNIPENEDTLLG